MQRISTVISEYRYKIMFSVLKLIEKDPLPPVIMCVGCNSTSGDKLGPLVGELLTHKYNIRTFVYGTVNRPLTAINVAPYYNFIKRNHTSKILVVDAALGSEKDYGVINIYKGGIKPAAAMLKNLPCIGDYSLIANVSMFGTKNLTALAAANMKSIAEMAENIAFGIHDAIVLHKAFKMASSINNIFKIK